MRGFVAIALAGLLAVAGPSAAQMTLTGAGGTRHVASASLACSYTPVTTGMQGTAYTGATPSASGGTPAYTFSETGTLPGGLSISSSTGIISGTPTANGSFPTIQVKVTDSTSTVANCGVSFTLVISPSGLPIYTYLGFSNQNGVVTSTATFTGFSFGTAASNRVIAVCILYGAGTPPTITAVTIGGISASQASGAAGVTATTGSDIWYASVPTGTSGNIVITFSAASTIAVGIEVAAIGTSTPTPGTGANFQQGFGSSANTTVTVPSGGVAFTGLVLQNGNTSTFSNLTVDDFQSGTGPGASDVYAGHQSVTGINTATFGGADRASMSTVPWGP